MKLSEAVRSKSDYEYIQLDLAGGGHVNITLDGDRLTVCRVYNDERDTGGGFLINAHVRHAEMSD